MDPGEAIVARSERQYLYGEDSKNSFGGDNYHHTNFFTMNDYSDIYYDKSWVNMEEVSVWNFSNYPKEIRLDESDASDDEIFLKPKPFECNLHRQHSLWAKKSYWALESDLDEEISEVTPKYIKEEDEKDYSAEKSASQTITVNSREEEQNKDLLSYEMSNRNPQNLDQNPLNAQSFTKNEGKLIFRITRFNKLTQKEKLLTKNRRIISKCPHTSCKYYAKGMCKKWYHNFGREKKAFVWGHTDKPLYAKGFCKRCYLSKYKQKTNIKSEIKTMEDSRMHKINSYSEAASKIKYELVEIGNAKYFGNIHSMPHE